MLSRVISKSYPHEDGTLLTSSTEYQPFSTVVTDALNRSEVSTRNIYDQVISVTDADYNVLTYSYDSLGNLLTTTDPDNNVISNSYDTRGRKLAMSDPDMGGWSYSYSTFGELLTQTDAKGQVTQMDYDLLGRMTSRTDLFGTGSAKTNTWTFDAGTKGIGKLTTSSNGGSGNTASSKSFSAHKTKASGFAGGYLRVPGMAHLPKFQAQAWNDRSAVTGRKDDANRARASPVMGGLKEA